jgi:hypothetical protein
MAHYAFKLSSEYATPVSCCSVIDGSQTFCQINNSVRAPLPPCSSLLAQSWQFKGAALQPSSSVVIQASVAPLAAERHMAHGTKHYMLASWLSSLKCHLGCVAANYWNGARTSFPGSQPSKMTVAGNLRNCAATVALLAHVPTPLSEQLSEGGVTSILGVDSSRKHMPPVRSRSIDAA